MTDLVHIGRCILLASGLVLGASSKPAVAQGQFEFGNSGTSKQKVSAEDQKVIDAAERARRDALNSLDAAKGRRMQSERTELKNATSNQIRNQLQTIKDINSTFVEAAAERKRKLASLENEMEELLSQIRSLRHQRNRGAKSAPKVTQISEQKSTSEPIENKQAGTSSKSAAPRQGDTSKAQPKQETSFSGLASDPVDRLSLADALIESQNYRTAQGLLLDLLKDQSMTDSDLNWIRYQLACCYRRLKAFPEAEQQLRNAANSKKQEVARTTAIWWLEQMEKQRKMYESLDAMDQQLEALGQGDADGK